VTEQAPIILFDQPIAFVGREPELTFLERAAADPDCRGVVVYGLGGIGKTSLLRVLASRLQALGKPVVFLDLGSSFSVEEIFFELSGSIRSQLQERLISRHKQITGKHEDANRFIAEPAALLSEIGEAYLFFDSIDIVGDREKLELSIRRLILETPHDTKFFMASRFHSILEHLDQQQIRAIALGPLQQEDVFRILEQQHTLPIDLAAVQKIQSMAHGNPLLVSVAATLFKEFDLQTLPESNGDIVENILMRMHEREESKMDPDLRHVLRLMLFVVSGYDEHSVSADFLEVIIGKSPRDFPSISMFYRRRRAGMHVEFSHIIFKDFYRRLFAGQSEIDFHSLDFGAEEAERDKKLHQEFMAPPIMADILSGDKTIILGDRGSGKSAMLRHLHSVRATLAGRPTKGISGLAPLPHLPTFIARYNRESNGNQLDADGFKELWLLYCTEALARYAFGTFADNARAVPAIKKLLRRQCPDVLRAAAVTPVGRLLTWLAEHTQAKVSFAFLGIPLTFEASGKDVKGRVVDLRDVVESVSSMLRATKITVGVVLDGIDEVYKHDRVRQEKMVQGLFLAESEMAKYEAIKLIILMRTDLYAVYDIQEKSKRVSRTGRLTWDYKALYKMMLARVAGNSSLGMAQNLLSPKRNGDEDEEIRYRLRVLLPETVEGDSTREWLERHLRNGRGRISPRQIVTLLIALRDAVIEEPKRAGPLPLFEEHHVRRAMDRLSELSYEEVLSDFRVGEALMMNCRAGNVRKMSMEKARQLTGGKDGEADKQLRLLERLGVLERWVEESEAGVMETGYRLPPLYTRCWADR